MAEESQQDKTFAGVAKKHESRKSTAVLSILLNIGGIWWTVSLPQLFSSKTELNGMKLELDPNLVSITYEHLRCQKSQMRLVAEESRYIQPATQGLQHICCTATSMSHQQLSYPIVSRKRKTIREIKPNQKSVFLEIKLMKLINPKLRVPTSTLMNIDGCPRL